MNGRQASYEINIKVTSIVYGEKKHPNSDD